MSCTNKVEAWAQQVQRAAQNGNFGDYCRAATVKGVTTLVTASSTGATTNTAAVEGTAGDYIRLEGYGQERYRLVGIIFSDGSAAAAHGIGKIHHRGQTVAPQLKGTFSDGLTSSEFMTLAAFEAGINALPVDCLPSFSEGDPLDLSMYNTAGTNTAVEMLLVYVPA